MSTPQAKPIIPPAEDRRPKDVPKESEAETPKSTPKSTGPKGPGSTSTVSGKPGKFHRELAELFSLPALLFEFTGQKYPAYVWNLRITTHAYAWADLAEKNPALKRKLQAMMEGGAYGAVIISGLAVLVPILAYYGIYPSSMINPFALSPAEQLEYEGFVQGSNGSPFQFSWGEAEDTGASGIPYPVT